MTPTRREYLVNMMIDKGSPETRDDLREALDVAAEAVDKAFFAAAQHCKISRNPQVAFMLSLREILSLIPQLMGELTGLKLTLNDFTDIKMPE